MEKILCDIQLGVLKQQVFIIGEKYNNKRTVESFTMQLDEIPDFIMKQNIHEVVLKGPKRFTNKIEQETKEKQICQYHETKIKFKYM